MTAMNETEELEMLRRRVGELEAELATSQPAAAAPAARPRARWRAVTAAVLITLACLLAPLSVTAVWANNQVSNTDRYVATVAPLAEDPAVQKAVADRVTAEIFARVDVNAITGEVLDAVAARGLPPRAAAGLQSLQAPMVQGIKSFTRTEVGKIIASPAFATVWEQANRAAHAQLVKLMSGQQGGAVSAQNDTVTLNLGPIVAQVKQRLVAEGFSFANNIPAVDKSFVLVRSDAVTKAQGVYRLLDTLGTWLPVIALVLLGLGVYVARGHRRALMLGALGVAGSMLALGVLLAVARPLYLDAVPADALPRDAAGNIFDTLVRFLRTGLRTTAVLALVVALGAFLTGPSVTATRTRSGAARLLGSLRGNAESAGLRTGRVGTWTFAHKRALRVGIVLAGALTLTFWSQPTGAVVVVTALVVLFLVGLVELLGRPPTEQATAVSDQAPGSLPRQREAGSPTATELDQKQKEKTPHA